MEDFKRCFAIPKHLNKGKRLIGLPRDEVLPAGLVFLLELLAGHYVVGFALGATWLMGLRYLKVQYGDHILALALYWWGATPVNRRVFKRTPPAHWRYWLG